MVGGEQPLVPEISAKTDHVSAEMLIFSRYLLVALLL